MNRRDFLKGVGTVAAAAMLPRVVTEAPLSGFDKLVAAHDPTMVLTYEDVARGREMMRKGWPDPFEPNKLYIFDPPLEFGHNVPRQVAIYDKALSSSEVAEVSRRMAEL